MRDVCEAGKVERSTRAHVFRIFLVQQRGTPERTPNCEFWHVGLIGRRLYFVNRTLIYIRFFSGLLYLVRCMN